MADAAPIGGRNADEYSNSAVSTPLRNSKYWHNPLENVRGQYRSREPNHYREVLEDAAEPDSTGQDEYQSAKAETSIGGLYNITPEYRA